MRKTGRQEKRFREQVLSCVPHGSFRTFASLRPLRFKSLLVAAPPRRGLCVFIRHPPCPAILSSRRPSAPEPFLFSIFHVPFRQCSFVLDIFPASRQKSRRGWESWQIGGWRSRKALATAGKHENQIRVGRKIPALRQHTSERSNHHGYSQR